MELCLSGGQTRSERILMDMSIVRRNICGRDAKVDFAKIWLCLSNEQKHLRRVATGKGAICCLCDRRQSPLESDPPAGLEAPVKECRGLDL